MLTIRSYEDTDRDATIEIFLGAIRQTAARDYTPAQITAWAQVADPDAWHETRLSRPTWIAELDGRPVGFTDLGPDGLIDMLFVAPDAAGRGVAARLLQQVNATALAAGMARLWTQASLTAEGFFARHGFGVVRRQIVERRGQRLRNALMDKALPTQTAAELSSVTLQAAEQADVAALSAFSVATYVAAFGAGFTPADLASHLARNLSMTRWRDYLASDSVLMAIANQAPVGFVQFGPGETPDAWGLHRLYVAAHQQGRGVGSMLLDTALKRIDHAGARTVTLTVWGQNAGAIRLYERAGFVPVDRVPFTTESGAVLGHDLVMRRG
ncbi:GNAT family N-acetyltransferase [Devosia sp.]|uniref:GNAT family N-acetyltransferase n=1 Tax=Devosia sp. TaxID=1871048 RepID=UPI003A8F3917